MLLNGTVASAVVFGLSGGLSPGPTNTLIVSQTLQFGRREGCKVAIAPALTDAPIIAASSWVLGRLASIDSLLAAVSLLGACVLTYLGLASLRFRPAPVETEPARPFSILRGFLTNLLNPHPWLFWFAIGAPMLSRAFERGWIPALAFLVAMYVPLIGAKLLLAMMVARGRSWIEGRGYRYVLRALGLLLLIYAGVFLNDALELMGWI